MTWLQLKLSNTFTAEYHYLQVGYSLLNLLTYCDNMPRYTRLYEIVKMEPVVKQTVFFFKKRNEINKITCKTRHNLHRPDI